MADIINTDTEAKATARSVGLKRLWAEGGYVLCVIAVSLLAAWRLGGPGVISNYDSELHLYRTFVLDRALREGLLFPRVAPDFMFGYGYPLFNFYPPASAYFVELLHLLGFGFISALRTAYETCFVIGAITMYAFARPALVYAAGSGVGVAAAQRKASGIRAGALVAASAYVLAPYYLINVYTRGALAEALAMALFPALLLAVQRLAGGGYGAAIAVAMLTALLVLTHSGLALMFLPVAAGYGLLVIYLNARVSHRRALWLLVGGLLLGLGLSAFSWLPAALERGLVSIQNLQTGPYDVHGNFQSWSALVSHDLFYPPTDPIPNPPHVGLFQAFLGVLALPLCLRRSLPVRAIIAFWVAVVLGALFLMTPGSAPVWETLPLLKSLSFSWRMLSVAGLGLSLLAGYFVVALQPKLAAPAACAIVMLSIAFTLPRIAPKQLALTEGDLSIARYWQFEFDTTMVGTTSANEYVPLALVAGSHALPRAPEGSPGTQAQEAEFSGTVRLLDAAAQYMRLRTLSSDRTRIIAHAVYFPGWRAAVDGVASSPYASTPLGLVTVDVPAGEHDVLIYYDQSDVARWAEIISLLGALALAIALLVGKRRGSRLMKLQPITAWALVVASLLVVAIALFYPLSHPLAGAAAIVAPQGSDATGGVATAELQLLGWHPPSQSAGSIRFELYWLARRTPAKDEVVVLTLRDAHGAVRARWERQPGYGYSPTRRWVAGEIVPDEYALQLPQNLGAGDYTLAVGLEGAQGSVTIGKVHSPAAAPGRDLTGPHQ